MASAPLKRNVSKAVQLAKWPLTVFLLCLLHGARKTRVH